MLGKLAYRNTKRNIKDYLIYLITVTTSFSLIFAFNLVASSDEIVKLCSSMDAFKNSLFAVNILITFVICFLINYTTKFMFEKRSKELGTYMLLGIKKKEIAHLVIIENTNADELKSIQVGGIDFITKPYDTFILLEKIKRALQLSNPNNFRELVKKDCTLDLHLSILKYQEQSIELTRNEFRILYYFFMNEDKVISKEELLEKLWNDKYYLDENVLLVNMTRLKKKMKEIGIVHLLENIRGKGWKL